MPGLRVFKPYMRVVDLFRSRVIITMAFCGGVLQPRIRLSIFYGGGMRGRGP